MESASDALAPLRAIEAGWVEIQPVRQVRNTALRLLRIHALGAADALQLAAAIIATEQGPPSLECVCLDHQLREAAEREGFSVLSFADGRDADAMTRRLPGQNLADLGSRLAMHSMTSTPTWIVCFSSQPISRSWSKLTNHSFLPAITCHPVAVCA